MGFFGYLSKLSTFKGKSCITEFILNVSDIAVCCI